MLVCSLATPGSPRAMSTGATAIELFTDAIKVISDRPNLYSNLLDLFEFIFQSVELLHNTFHPVDFVVCSLHGICGATAGIRDRSLCRILELRSQVSSNFWLFCLLCPHLFNAPLDGPHHVLQMHI